VPRFLVRHRSDRHTSQLRVLTQQEAGSLGPRPLLPRARGWRVVAATLALSLALHLALLAALHSETARDATAPPVELFPVVLIWEEPPAAPAATPAAPAPAARVAPKRPRAVTPPPRALPPARPAPPAPEPGLAEAAPAPALPAVAAAPALRELAPPAFVPEAWLRVIAQPAPHYPYGARRRGAEGIAWLRVDLAASGRVQRVEVERSTGHRDLDRAAVAAVRSWRFAPLPEEMEASDLWFRVPVEFRLH
jgi:protein TonB